MTEKYLSIREVAKILGVTPLTLRNWDRKGLLGAYRNPINNYRMYRYADVSDFLAAMKRTRPRRDTAQRIPVTLVTDETAGELPPAPLADGASPPV